MSIFSSPDPQPPIPPFAQVRAESGVTELSVGTRTSKAIKLFFWLGAAVCIAGFIALFARFQSYEAAESWPSAWVLVPEIACMVAIICLAIFGATFLMINTVRGSVVFDGVKLRLKDQASTYEIPFGNIRAIRQVKYPGTRLEIDTSGPLRHLFFRGKRTAMQVVVPEGRIEFFQHWGEPEVEWLTTQVHRLLFPGSEEQSPALIEGREDDDVVVANRMYGNARRWMLRVTTIVTMLATVLSGWYAFQGLSSNNWPTTEGRVLHSRYEKTRGSREGDTYHNAEIKYTYSVLGITHTNDDFGFDRNAGDTVVRKLIAEHPEGSTIRVYYKPSRPEKSIVIPGLGASHWLLCGISVMPLILIIPLARRRTTLTQDALSRRYKIATAPDAKDREQQFARLRWSMPHDAWRASVRSAKKSSLAMAGRLVVAVALVLWAAHHWFAPLTPPELPWIRIYQIIMGMTVAQSASLVVAPFLGRAPPAYGLTDEGILIPSAKFPLVRWGRVASFEVRPDKQSPNFRVLILHLSSGVGRVLALPGDNLDAAIVAEVSQRLPESPPPPTAAALSGRDWALGFLFTALVIWAASGWLIQVLHTSRVKDLQWIMIGGFLVGPGTWIAVLLRRRRAVDQLVMLGVALNFIATIGSMTTAVLARLLTVAQ